MVYRISFEADVQGIATSKRITGDFFVYGKDISTAKNYATGYLTDCYGAGTYAILEVLPMFVMNME